MERVVLIMSDFINECAVECFPTPQQVDVNTFHISYQTTNRNFDLGETVPCKSYFYDYSDNFIVFDYTNETELIAHVIENGICEYSIPAAAFPNDYPISIVINKEGIPLNIKSTSDFIVIAQEYYNNVVNYKKNFWINLEQHNISNENYKDSKNKEFVKRAKQMAFMNTFFHFQNTWFNLNLAEEMHSNIVGVLYETIQSNTCNRLAAKHTFNNYCNKNKLIQKNEIDNYYEWSQLHSFNISKEELIKIFL